MKIRSFSFALISSIGLLILVVAPFIFSQKYQSWFLQNGVKGYTFSVLIAVILCLIFAIVIKKINSKVSVIIATLIFCGSHFVNRQSQENILLDNLRWVSIEAIYKTSALQKFLLTSEEVYAPVLWDHSWWMGFHDDVDKNYWKKYTEKFFKKIEFVKERNQTKPISVFDYQNEKILFVYKSDNLKKEVFNIIVAHPRDITIRLLTNERSRVDGGLTTCSAEFCETVFLGIFKSDIAIITPLGSASLRVY